MAKEVARKQAVRRYCKEREVLSYDKGHENYPKNHEQGDRTAVIPGPCCPTECEDHDECTIYRGVENNSNPVDVLKLLAKRYIWLRLIGVKNEDVNRDEYCEQYQVNVESLLP